LLGLAAGSDVGFIGDDGTLMFNNVIVANIASSVVKIASVDADSGRSVDVTVNGGTPLMLNFADTNDSNWDTRTPPPSRT
jgi:alpha-galactosidase